MRHSTLLVLLRLAVAATAACTFQTADGTKSSTPASSSSPSSSSSSASTQTPNAVDTCAANGGQLLSDGFCFKNCTYDAAKPGNDLFGDCAGLKSVCVNDATTLKSSPGYCLPGTWKGECTSDASCGAGAKCVTSTGSASGTRSYCKIGCEADADCGSLRCVTSCASGYFHDLRFCADNYGWPPSSSEPSLCNEP